MIQEKDRAAITTFYQNSWLDGMMGLIVGDALGVPVQFMSRGAIRDRAKGPVTGMESGGVFNTPAGTWSDDSSMALATMESIRRKGCVDPEDIMQNFVKWLYGGEFTPFEKAFDQGNTCVMAISKFAETADWQNCGRTGESANGNGALMRILPVCLHYLEKYDLSDEGDAEATGGIHLVSGLTHNHIRSQMACGLYYFMAKEILKDRSRPLTDCLQGGMDAGWDFYKKDIARLTELSRFERLFYLEEFAETPEREIKSSGYVLDSIEAAVWCLITTDNLKDCLLKAVNLGDDSDTVAAIAGGLAGLYYGYQAIPEEWLEVIQKREWLEDFLHGAV